MSRVKFPTESNLGNCGLTHRTEHSEQAYISDDHALINVIHWMKEVVDYHKKCNCKCPNYQFAHQLLPVHKRSTKRSVIRCGRVTSSQ